MRIATVKKSPYLCSRKLKKDCMLSVLAGMALAVGIPVEVDTLGMESVMDEVVIVSPIKETKTIRKQASSVSKVSNKQMEENHITSLKGVSSLVPNFFMPDYGSRLTSAIYIRGIGSRLNTPAVGMYVDNVPFTDKSAYDYNLYDIERVDVLRGPQGTLYGRNSMGGIVKVHTKNPFNYQGTNVSLGFATGDYHRNASLTHYLRLSDQFALSAGGYYEGGSGFFKNDFTGEKADGMESGGGRLRAIYKPCQRLMIDASLSYDYSDEYAYPYFYAGQLGASEENPEPYPGLVGKISANHDGRYRRSLLNGGLNIEYKAKTWQMNAVTGYQHLRDRMFIDQDFLMHDIYTIEQKQRSHNFSEEITFKSTKKSVWEWVFGANVMHQWLRTEGPVTFYDEGAEWLSGLINANMPDVSTIPSLSGMGFASMSVNFRNAPFTMGGQFETPMLNAALFHQSTFNITSHLSASLGLRLDFERNRLTYNAPAHVDYGFTLANSRIAMMNVDLQDLQSGLLYEGKLSDKRLNVMPKFSLMYDFGTMGNVYFSLGKGMRSGGYNVQMFSDLLQGAMRADMMDGVKDGVSDYLKGVAQIGMPASVIDRVTSIMEQHMPNYDVPSVDAVTYKPEYSWNYELGTHLNFFQNRLQADAALFYLHTRDQQIARFADSGMGRMMVNAGKSENYGAELSLRYTPCRSFALAGSYGYTHAKFTDYDGGKGTDYSGNYVPFAPQHTFNVDAAYTWFPRCQWARSFALAANCGGAGKIYWTEANTSSQDFYALLGARMSLSTRYVDFTLWGKNLTNKRYNTFYFESVNRGYEQHGKPLQIGFDVKVRL